MTKNASWTKHGEWRPESGPWYRHSSGRVAVAGGWGAVGDNVRGWRKTRSYRIVVIGEDGAVSHNCLVSFSAAARAKDYAERKVLGIAAR